MEIKLPSDVLFEFAQSDLTPAAQSALDEVDNQIESTTGTITIEGHTDAIGDDASNLLLSEARAASVQAALQEKLGSGFTFNAVGFGEYRPVAPNTNPDGSDNPDGRAQNRRVEIGNTVRRPQRDIGFVFQRAALPGMQRTGFAVPRPAARAGGAANRTNRSARWTR